MKTGNPAFVSTNKRKAKMSNNFQRIVASFFDDNGNLIRKVNNAAKNSIEHDKWDRQVFDDILKSINALGGAQDDLTRITDTAPPAIADAFWTLLKVEPEMKAVEDMTPSHAINHAVMEELNTIPEIQKLRFESTLDSVASAFGVVDIEPKLEIIFDRLQDLQDQAQQLEDDLIQLSDGSTMGGGGEPQEGETNGQGNAQSNQELAKKAQELMDRAKSMDQQFQDQSFQMSQDLKSGMNEAFDNAKNEAAMSDAWGLGAGGLKSLSPNERIELSYKLRNEKFKRIAKLFGPLLKLAIAEQDRKVKKMPQEVMDIEQGDDIAKVLASSLIYFFDEDLEILFYKELYDKQLLQYAYDGEENIGRGSIILCEDGSGSMSGQREIWAKAVSLALLYIASRQKRDFTGIHFGGPGEFKVFEFEPKSNKVTTTYGHEVKTMTRLAGTVEWAETFFGGGTDFYTPLSVAMGKLVDEFDKTGKVSGDIVFVTDGSCALTNEFIAEFKLQKNRCGFKVWAILIGVDKTCLNEFADKIIHLDEILENTDGKDIAGVFGGV